MLPSIYNTNLFVGRLPEIMERRQYLFLLLRVNEEATIPEDWVSVRECETPHATYVLFSGNERGHFQILTSATEQYPEEVIGTVAGGGEIYISSSNSFGFLGFTSLAGYNSTGGGSVPIAIERVFMKSIEYRDMLRARSGIDVKPVKTYPFDKEHIGKKEYYSTSISNPQRNVSLNVWGCYQEVQDAIAQI